MAAGLLLVEEAGGRVSDMKGGPASLRGPHVLADNGAVHDQILERFAEVFAGKFRVPVPMINAAG
jgi:myo-inositol-1(or 4)-monophosphatase